MALSRSLQVGAVNYLNSKPLVYGLRERLPGADLVFDLPSRLADGLEAGRFDVALIPSVEMLRNPSYQIVSDAVIACRGPVLSVKLFSRVPLAEIRTLALDEGSRTSVALVQILLLQRYGLQPALQPLESAKSLGETDTDAVLLIGDRAIHSPAGPFAAIWDLGDEWWRQYQLPFVFAMWTARPEVAVDEQLTQALRQARDSGVAAIEGIAAAESAALGLTIPECIRYLRDNLHFVAGPDEMRGLEFFRQQAADLQLVPRGLEPLHAT